MSDIEGCIANLKDRFGDQISTSESVLNHHGHDESWHETAPPDAIMFAEAPSDVALCAEVCSQYKVPIIPFGTGSSMEGNVNAIRGGVSINTSRMNTILTVNAADMDCEVEAGVTREELNHHLRDQGLFFPVDPGANASLGGMAATRASGTTTVKYGSMRENVIGLEVVLADGTTLRTGGRARKSSSGYDLTRLFVGSEGTLGIFTKVLLRLHPIPEVILAMSADFPAIESAVGLTCDIMQTGLSIARVELLDELAIEAINNYSKTTYPIAPTLFFEFHGNSTGVSETADLVQELCEDYGAGTVNRATSQEDRNRIWNARHNLAFAERTLRPGAQSFVTDVAVPVSSLPTAIRTAKEDLVSTGLVAPLCGHVGDGNFHFALLINKNDAQEIELAEAFHDRLIENALKLGGTVSGEHGIGMGKILHFNNEHGNAVTVMRSIKLALDPHQLLNPGKLFS